MADIMFDLFDKNSTNKSKNFETIEFEFTVPASICSPAESRSTYKTNAVLIFVIGLILGMLFF